MDFTLLFLLFLHSSFAFSFLCVLVFILCSLAAQLRRRQYINIHVEEAENLDLKEVKLLTAFMFPLIKYVHV